jgi:hypothetical protein
MRTGVLRLGLVAVGVVVTLMSAAPVRAQDPSAFDEVLKILKRGGMIDEAGETKVKALYAAEQKRNSPKWLEGFEFTGDFRARYDGTFYDRDAAGNELENRGRGRYRARFGFAKTLGDRIRLGVRLSSGTTAGDRRSGNVSFGEGANDEFGPDTIFFDRVFAELKLHGSEAGQTQIVVGRTPNPFVSRIGPDHLIFDQDIALEGAYLAASYRISETTRLYASAGGFTLDEVGPALGANNPLRSGSRDPKLIAAQTGFETRFGPAVTVGLRASSFQFRSLDAAFIGLGAGSGNLASGFDVSPCGAVAPAVCQHTSGIARIGETLAYAQFNGIANWPVLVYGQAIRNFTAESAGAFGAEDMGYGVGLELGDAAKFLRLGLGWFHLEANAVVAQLSDSDQFDGFTNREGWQFFVARRLTPNAELRLTFFDGEEIESGPGFNVANARRRRVMADALFSF